jgi:hypothetical protein
LSYPIIRTPRSIYTNEYLKPYGVWPVTVSHPPYSDFSNIPVGIVGFTVKKEHGFHGLILLLCRAGVNCNLAKNSNRELAMKKPRTAGTIGEQGINHLFAGASGIKYHV